MGLSPLLGLTFWVRPLRTRRHAPRRLDVVVDAGATCVARPGGSMRDHEVIDAANERGVAMVFTGVRHFRH